MAGPDLSEFVKLSQRDQRKPCKVAAAVAPLSTAERAQFDAAVESDKTVITAAAIIKWLELRNVCVSVSALASHRARRCACNG
jgi:hypothetical protein